MLGITKIRHSTCMRSSRNAQYQSNDFFRRPPTTNLRRTPIESVVLLDGSESSDPNAIAVEFSAHIGVGSWVQPSSSSSLTVNIKSRQSASLEESQRRLLDSVSKTLNIDQRTSLDAQVTVTEFQEPIKSLAPFKDAPGSDGVTAAFYQIAPNALALFLFLFLFLPRSCVECSTTNLSVGCCYRISASRAWCLYTRRAQGHNRATTV